jgi:colicin import membrane protein
MQSRDELKQDERRLYSWIGIAAAAHVLVIAAVVVLQLLYVRMHPPLKIISVSLMQMPGLPGPAGGPKSVEAPVADVEKQPEASEPAGAKKVAEPPPPQPAKKVAESAPPQPAKKISEPAAVKKIPEKPPLKAPVKTPEPTPKKQSAADERKNLQAALERLKTNTAARKTETGKTSASAPSNLSSTLAGLQKKVAGGGGPASFGSGSGAGGGRYGAGGGGAFDPYMTQIAGIIQNNWEFSSLMIRSTTGMEVYVSLLILPDGSVSQIRYDRKSSSEYLNNSVKVALAKSTPFPAPPRAGGSKGRWVGFVFTPEGIKP